MTKQFEFSFLWASFSFLCFAHVLPILMILFFSPLETGFLCVVQAGLELAILQPLFSSGDVAGCHA